MLYIVVDKKFSVVAMSDKILGAWNKKLSYCIDAELSDLSKAKRVEVVWDVISVYWYEDSSMKKDKYMRLMSALVVEKQSLEYLWESTDEIDAKISDLKSEYTSAMSNPDEYLIWSYDFEVHDFGERKRQRKQQIQERKERDKKIAMIRDHMSWVNVKIVGKWSTMQYRLPADVVSEKIKFDRDQDKLFDTEQEAVDAWYSLWEVEKEEKESEKSKDKKSNADW